MADFIDITFYDKDAADGKFLPKPATSGTAGQTLVLANDGTTLIWSGAASSGYDGGTQY